MLFRYLPWEFEDWCFAWAIGLIHDRLIGAALVHGELFSSTPLPITGPSCPCQKAQHYGLFALDSQQKNQALQRKRSLV